MAHVGNYVHMKAVPQTNDAKNTPHVTENNSIHMRRCCRMNAVLQTGGLNVCTDHVRVATALKIPASGFFLKKKRDVLITV